MIARRWEQLRRVRMIFLLKCSVQKSSQMRDNRMRYTLKAEPATQARAVQSCLAPCFLLCLRQPGNCISYLFSLRSQQEANAGGGCNVVMLERFVVLIA